MAPGPSLTAVPMVMALRHSEEMMMSKLPKPFLEFTENYPDVAEAYEKLGEACHSAGPLSAKERALVKLGIAMGARLEGAVHAQARKSLAAGVNPSEIRHAVLMACTTVGFPPMMASMTWVEDVLKGADGKKAKGGKKK
ncbi:MAG: carboxymuconolactone decarboxylase family protein [Acidobacteriota bacterium]